MNIPSPSGFIAILLLATTFCVASAQTGGLKLELTSPTDIVAGSTPLIEMQITNESGQPVEFVGPLDGSWNHWRYPHISAEVTAPDGSKSAVKPSGRCGNMNSLEDQDVFTLGKDERQKHTLYWPGVTDLFQKEGVYKYVLSYDLRSPNTVSWGIPAGQATKLLGNGPQPATVERLKRIPALLLVSAPLVIHSHKVIPKMLGRMISKHFSDFDSTEFAFVEKDFAQGKWTISDVRQSNNMISCLVQFDKHYKLPPKPTYIAADSWFTKGRYLLRPTSSKGAIKALENVESSGYEISLPSSASRNAEHWQPELQKQLGF